jgi:hypothetical protein
MALSGTGIGGIVARGGAAAGCGFFMVGGARGGAFRFAVARDFGARDGATALAVLGPLPVGFAMAGTEVFFLGLIRGLAAGILMEDGGGGGALARRLGWLRRALTAGFGAATVRRVDRRAG